METDEMELDTLGDRKTALFVIISDTDDTFNFVVSILYTQLFNLFHHCQKSGAVKAGAANAIVCEMDNVCKALPCGELLNIAF